MRVLRPPAYRGERGEALAKPSRSPLQNGAPLSSARRGAIYQTRGAAALSGVPAPSLPRGPIGPYRNGA